MKSWLKIFITADKNWNADKIFQHSAAVSFYTLFSLAPITIIAVTVVGIFFGKDTATAELQKQVSALVGPASAELVQAAAKASETQGTSLLSTAIGVVLLLFGATTVFGQLQDSLNQIWGVKTKPSKSGWLVLAVQRLLSLAMVFTLGFLLLVSLIISTALTSALGHFGNSLGNPTVLKIADLGLGLGVDTVLFAMLFKVLPDVHLRWRDVWIGALLTSIFFTIGRYLISLYLAHSTAASIYGAAGSLVAVLIWVYYSCAILFFGVEFTRAYRAEQHLKTEPKEIAVLVEEVVPADEQLSPAGR